MKAPPARSSRSRTPLNDFGGLVAVSNMSFDVAEHEMVGVIGPNGSGKTTMINMISGVFRPDRRPDFAAGPFDF